MEYGFLLEVRFTEYTASELSVIDTRIGTSPFGAVLPPPGNAVVRASIAEEHIMAAIILQGYVRI